MGNTCKEEALAQKYNDFQQPMIQILLSGKEVKLGNGIYLNKAEITSSCRKEPNMTVLEFSVDRVQGTAAAVLEGFLALGCKAEIMLGYENSMTQVFLGYLHEIEVTAGESDEAVYELTCLDVKGRMMADSLYETSGQKKEEQLLKELLQKPVYKPYIQKQKITAIEGYMNKIGMVNGQSDFDWISDMAEYLNYEFFLCGGSLHFQKSREDTSVLMELTRDYGIKEIQTTATLAGQNSDVEIVGYNRMDQRLSAKAQRKNAGGPFEDKLSSFLSGSSRTFLESSVEEQTQAVYRAKALMNRTMQRAAGMKVVTIGIPELEPGRFVKVTDDIMASLSGTIYLEEVTHFYGQDGYWTMMKGYR